MEKGDEIQGVAAPQGVVMSQPAQQGVVDAAWSLGPAQARMVDGSAQIHAPGRWLAPCMPADRFNGQTFCLAMCCRCIYIAQLHERVVKRQSFPKVLGILVVVQVVGWILKFYGEHIFIEVHTGNRMIDALGWLPILVTELAVGLVYLKYVIAIRKQMRARDHIQDESGACGSECCTSYFCQLCVLCQMFAHDNQLKGLGSPSCDFSPMGMNGRQNYPLVEGEHVV